MHKVNIQSRRQKTKRQQAAGGKARNISRDQQTFNSNSRGKLGDSDSHTVPAAGRKWQDHFPARTKYQQCHHSPQPWLLALGVEQFTQQGLRDRVYLVPSLAESCGEAWQGDRDQSKVHQSCALDAHRADLLILTGRGNGYNFISINLDV